MKKKVRSKGFCMDYLSVPRPAGWLNGRAYIEVAISLNYFQLLKPRIIASLTQNYHSATQNCSPATVRSSVEAVIKYQHCIT